MDPSQQASRKIVVPSSPNEGGSSNLFATQNVTIIVALAIVLLSIILYLLSRRSQRKVILLVGLADSGKTTLIGQLVHGVHLSTVTSMKENMSELALRGDSRNVVTVVDIPGFERLRTQFWDKFKQLNKLKGIVYVLDSTTFMGNVHNVADLLYQTLCDPVVVSGRTPILVACTKQDETRAKSVKVIAGQLEKEFHTIRDTRAGALDSTSGSGEDGNTRTILGNINKTFAFSDLKNNIEFVECSSGEDKVNVDGVLKWIESVA